MSKNNKVTDYSVELDRFIQDLKYYISGAFFVLALTYFLPRWISSVPFSLDSAVWGAIGDFFGGLLNPILSILTILLLVRSLRLQNKELSDATKELSLTREVHTQSLLYEDTTKIFKKRVSDIMLHREKKVFEVKSGHELFPTDDVTFRDSTEEIISILNFEYDEIRQKVLFSESDFEIIKDNVDHIYFSLNQELIELSSAATDLLKMGVPTYLIRDELQTVHGFLFKMHTIAQNIQTHRMNKGWKMYEELIKNPDIVILC